MTDGIFSRPLSASRESRRCPARVGGLPLLSCPRPACVSCDAADPWQL